MTFKTDKEAFDKAQGVSYSRLSALANGPQAYRAYIAEDKESSAITLGSVVDILLTEPDKLKEKVYIMSENPPSVDTMKTYVEELLEHGNKDVAYTQSGYKISQERVEKKFESEGKTYYDAVIQAGERSIIGVDDMIKANQMVAAVYSNPKIQHLFQEDKRNKNIDVHYQVPLLWDFPVKSLVDGKTFSQTGRAILDILEIDHDKKLIIPWEFKTGGEGFYKSYRKYKRYLQGGMYYDAVFLSDSGLPNGYTILPTKFIYVDTNLVYPPIVYAMSEIETVVARSGVNYITHSGSFHKDFKVKGYKQLAAELDWHIKNDLWDYSYDVYQNNCEIEIDSFSIKL